MEETLEYLRNLEPDIYGIYVKKYLYEELRKHKEIEDVMLGSVSDCLYFNYVAIYIRTGDEK